MQQFFDAVTYPLSNMIQFALRLLHIISKTLYLHSAQGPEWNQPTCHQGLATPVQDSDMKSYRVSV